MSALSVVVAEPKGRYCPALLELCGQVAGGVVPLGSNTERSVNNLCHKDADESHAATGKHLCHNLKTPFLVQAVLPMATG